MGATVFWADPASELATLQNVFEVGGVPSDATTVTLVVTDPAGVSATYTDSGTIAHTDVGTYSQDVPATLDGIWTYKWTGTGAATDVQEGTFTVGPSQLSQNYCSIEEVKSRLGITDSVDDFELGIAVAGASRAIDQYTGRYFWRAADTRTYVPETWWRQPLDDLVSVTTLAVDRDGDGTFEETWAQNVDYALEVAPGRYNVSAKGEAWPYTAAVAINGGKLFPFVWMFSHFDRVQVTGTFGWPAVPYNVKTAALLLAPDLFRRKDAPFGIAGVNEFGVLRIQQDPMLKDLLARYKDPARVGV